MPLPDTECKHETNPNHYSVFGRVMWAELARKVGFVVTHQFDINFDIPQPDGRVIADTYFAMILEKQ